LSGVSGLNGYKAKGRVICAFSIVQRVIDKPTGLSCVPFMTEIAEYFQCNINYRVGNGMVFVVNSNNKHYLTKSYFAKYPLMTSKHLDYLCFIKDLYI